MKWTLLFTASLFPVALHAQIHCGSLELEANAPINANFTFDSFSSYQAGITLNNVATLRVRVEEQAIPDPACKWFLTMEVNNNPGAGTVASEWETLSHYGLGTAPNPVMDILQVRIRNGCQTSPLDGVFQNFENNGDILDIIADLLPLTAAGSCTQNVNGPGSYLTNYDEYTFTVDLRVAPGYLFSPGIYELRVQFHLEEQM